MTAPFRHVFFDVDSTLVSIEGIDVLANGNPEIVALTNAAMNGEIPIDEVYGRRLEIIRPSRSDVERLGTRYVESLTPGTTETIAALRANHVQVYLVTAGIAQAIEILATHLSIPLRMVRAVRLDFRDDGSYADFDRRSPLTRTGGKEVVVRDIRVRTHGRAAFVGDGISDLEARAAVDLFIGFGGVRARAAVRERADVFIERNDLRQLQPHLLGTGSQLPVITSG